MRRRGEVYVSVDIETSGPIPGDYSMLTLGAALIAEPRSSLYLTIKPLNDAFAPDAMEVNKLSLSDLAERGQRPFDAMTSFSSWLAFHCGEDNPVFVGWNSPFDWSFVNWYFHHFLGDNPFGYAALDLKTYAHAVLGCPWRKATLPKLPPEYKLRDTPTHHALIDAEDQAEVYRRLIARREKLLKQAAS